MTSAEKRAAVGGFLWIVAAVQYFAAQFVVAAQWRTPYSWWDDNIGDLGNTACGQFLGHYVCSPLAGLMNASFIGAGLLTVAGAGLLHSVWPETGLATAGLLLWVVAGAGKVLVGVAPENENLSVHLMGALSIPVGSVAILLLALTSWRTGLGVFGIVVALLGFLGTALTFAAPGFIGVGGAERLAGYPGVVWLLVVGAAALLPRRESAQVLAQVP
jgi:hypothetical membrane protein